MKRGEEAEQSAPAKKPGVPKFEVVDLRPLDRTGSLRAFVAVRFGNWLTAKGFRLIQEPGKAAWVGLPCNVADEPDPDTPGGTRRRYHPTLEMPREWQDAIAEKVLEAWDAYLATGILPGRVIGGGGAR